MARRTKEEIQAEGLLQVRIEEIQEQMRDLDGTDKEAERDALELEMLQLQRGLREAEMDEFYEEVEAEGVDYADVEGQWRGMAEERDRLDERIQYLEQRPEHVSVQEREAEAARQIIEEGTVDREMGELYQAAAPLIGQTAAADLVERQDETAPPTLSQKVAERLARHPVLAEVTVPKTRTERIEAWGSHISRPEAEQSQTGLDR